MPLLTPGQERKRNRRWVAAAVLFLFTLPLLTAGTLYAVLRWAPLPSGETWQLGPCRVSLDGEDLYTLDNITAPAVDRYGGITVEFRSVHVGRRIYGLWIRR